MEASSCKFAVGDRVRVKAENSLGNPRTPRYIRGKNGVIAEVHGLIHNPRDHRDLYPPLYSVSFSVRDVFGNPSSDTLWVDVHEEWLEAS